MNKRAYMLGYMKANGDLQKIAFEDAYMGKNAAGSNWLPWNWGGNAMDYGMDKLKDAGKSAIRRVVDYGFNHGNKKYIQPLLAKSKKYALPIAFGGAALVGGAGLLFGGKGGGNNQASMNQFKRTMQNTAGNKTNPYGLPTQQGHAGTFDSGKWNG